jgi:hypothetical protein
MADNGRIQPELYDEMEQPLAAHTAWENVRRLRRVLDGVKVRDCQPPDPRI